MISTLREDAPVGVGKHSIVYRPRSLSKQKSAVRSNTELLVDRNPDTLPRMTRQLRRSIELHPRLAAYVKGIIR